MRLLVFDEVLFSGGVETLCFNLLPELSGLCEELVWSIPDHLRGEFRQRISDAGHVKLEGHNWPQGSMRSMAYSVMRRAGLAKTVSRMSRDARIRELVREHRCTHFLTTCVFDQPFPDVDLPVFGFVCDINPGMPPEARLNIGEWTRKAAGIFGISQFTCDELCRMYPAAVEKIHAVPLAAAPAQRGTVSAGGDEFDFYYPAAMNPHKNHLALFEACVRLARAGRDFRLVLSGPGTESFRDGGNFPNPKMRETCDYFRNHAELLNGRIEVKGDVGVRGVEDLYARTRCVILPSGYEGFGLPLAEAFQRGLPVICSDIPAHREQFDVYDPRPEAIPVPPGDASALASAMSDFLDQRVSTRAKDRPAPVCRWTWRDAARRCFEVMDQTQ